jgi:hypothetical protein
MESDKRFLKFSSAFAQILFDRWGYYGRLGIGVKRESGKGVNMPSSLEIPQVEIWLSARYHPCRASMTMPTCQGLLRAGQPRDLIHTFLMVS